MKGAGQGSLTKTKAPTRAIQTLREIACPLCGRLMAARMMVVRSHLGGVHVRLKHITEEQKVEHLKAMGMWHQLP